MTLDKLGAARKLLASGMSAREVAGAVGFRCQPCIGTDSVLKVQHTIPSTTGRSEPAYRCASCQRGWIHTVSYTHLTLPTKA